MLGYSLGVLYFSQDDKIEFQMSFLLKCHPLTFSILLADKKIFWFSKGPAESPLCTCVCGCVRPNRLSFSESSILSLKEGFGAAAKVMLAENSGIQSCYRYACRKDRTEFSSFHFPKCS